MVEYIGRYTHRIAISNHRLLDIDGGEVKFRYKKYKDNKVFWREMSLVADEFTPLDSRHPTGFIRRFLLQVVARGFKRIRHFGFLAPGCRTQALNLARSLLKVAAEKLEEAHSIFESWFENIAPNRRPGM